MYVIEANNSRRKWISGVFKEEKDAKKFFDLIPNNLKTYQKLYKISFESYPVFLIETDKFLFINESDLIKTLKDTELDEEGERVHFNYFRFDEEFIPDKPGFDYMGSLYHVHVTDNYLKEFYLRDNL